MKKIVFLFVCLLSGSANAALINFTGDITYHNDVVYTYFTLNNNATNVRVWTDSYQNGTNFDPITALWDSTGALIQENDDDSTINPSTQTVFDSGFNLPSLSAGTYLFTVATYNNFANGANLSAGFAFDSQTPIPLAQWDQPASGLNMGTHWSVWLDGVDSASNPNANSVPEPTSFILLALGMIGIGLVRKKAV